jgi:predicted MFS family arabinose efflux permease
VGLLAFLLSVKFIEAEEPTAAHTERFDWAGALLFAVGLLALMLGLNEGHDWGWTSPAIVACLAAAVVLLGAFVWLENRQPAPMLDLSLFKVRVFSAATASAILNYICLYFVIFLMPFYLMQGRNLGPAQAGLFLTAQPIIMAVAAPISGSLSDRMGSRLLSTLGMAIMAGGLFLLSRLGPTSPDSLILAGLAVAGLGTGIFISPNNSALLGSAPRQRQGIASGILATARNVGMVLGVGLAGAILTTFTATGGEAVLFSAVSTGFVVAGGLAVVGLLVSSVRGKTPRAEH